MSVLVTPVSELVSGMPNLASALECCSRIQNYVTAEKRVDFRQFTSNGKVSNLENRDGNVVTDSRIAIDLRQVNAGWSSDGRVFRGLTVQIPVGTLAMIVGPVGCGKSTLLQILLGEGILHNGSVTLSTDDIAYCDQVPFLRNGSIRQNIIANMEYNQPWYDSCLQACALDVDIQQFARGDETLVGNKGIALSGGQRQRLVCSSHSLFSPCSPIIPV